MSDDQAQDLNQPGHWLAHYTKAATAFEHIVPAGQLRMSPYHLLTAVVLGELFPTWQVAGARGVCEDAGVDLQKVVWVHGRPRCVPVDSFGRAV